MGDEKEVIIKISYVEDEALLESFLEEAKKIGLTPHEVRKKALPQKPAKTTENNTKDVMIAISGNPDDASKIISDFLERAQKELDLIPASTNEKLLDKNE